MMKQSAVGQAIKQFFKTTTLHGFKYLCSAYFIDRIGWLLCCCASACCAGVLCAVLWARFLELPALLALDDMRAHDADSHRMPLIAVCPTVESVADMFVDKLTYDRKVTKRLPLALASVLDGKSAAEDQLLLLDQLITANNVTLRELMFDYTPPCHELLRKCRWQKIMLPCDHLFQKEVTPWGICCVMKSTEKLLNSSGISRLRTNLQSTRRLDMALQCSNGSTLYSCEFFTKYDGEEWVDPVILTPRYSYIAQLRFTSVPESSGTENLVKASCVSTNGYSRSQCMDRCAEKTCGCSDPLSAFGKNGTNNVLPPCSITRLRCLRTNGIKNNISCNCLPSCKKVMTYMTLESNRMDFINYTIDPIYAGLNVTPSVVIHFRVNIGLSRMFKLNPTETWLTLLSSLGGVFNMFLGVGLFSALEFIFLIFVKLPIAIRKSTEIVHPSLAMH